MLKNAVSPGKTLLLAFNEESLGMKQLEIENQLRDVVSRIITQVELATKQNRRDINLALEDAFIPILKPIYNLPNLINLNRKHKNYPGIDLGDDHDRVAFQITSTTSLEKIKETLKQFVDKEFYNSFDELYVLVLTKKQASYSQTAVEKITDGKVSFSTKKHVIDLGDILEEVTKLRIPAQERILNEFKLILGEVDAYINLSEQTIPESLHLTSNLIHIDIPKFVNMAELVLDEKEIIAQARQHLNFKRKYCSKKSLVKMALLLNGIHTDSWVYYENKIFTFLDLERSRINEIIDKGNIETFTVNDFSDSDEIDNINIFKQLLFAHTQEKLKKLNVVLHAKNRFFYFTPYAEGDVVRKEEWVGKRKANRRVYEIIFQKKDTSKIAHHMHLSFDLSFTKISDQWYGEIVPSWYYSFDGIHRSIRHSNLLAQQKRLEFNQTVRNLVRFVAYFLNQIEPTSDNDLHYNGLLEFGAEGNISLDTQKNSYEEDIDAEVIAA